MKIGLNTNNTANIIYSNSVSSNKKKLNKNVSGNSNPNFEGVGDIIKPACGVAIAGLQACERMPMLNVALIDMISAILPRTFVESMTNWFAGFEAFRRESSGLVVNCIIPGFISLGVAKLVHGLFMPKGADLSNCLAGTSLIDKAKDSYINSNSKDKTKDAIKTIIADMEGFEGKRVVNFNDVLSKDIDDISARLAELVKSDKKGREYSKEFSKTIKSVANDIIEKTCISDNVRIVSGEKSIKASTVEAVLEDSVKFLRGFEKSGQKLPMEKFATQAKKLVRAKSWLALGIILPLAISMQYINRWYTGKISGVKGAPIYDDFGKENNILNDDPKAKKGLLKQKVISISTMLGVSLLSMMKKPSLEMLEFKGIFPTMDQARIISTATFASRMAAADDKNELAESTARDVATFSSLYFLGDYAAKALATVIQKTKGISLLNDTKHINKDANVLKKSWHWIKDVNLKSSEEVASLVKMNLTQKGVASEVIEKEMKNAKNIRSICQASNLGVSLLLLGVIIPVFTRKGTKKRHEQDLMLAREHSQNQQAQKN